MVFAYILLFDNVVRDPFLVGSYHPLQNRVELVPFQQHITGIDWAQNVSSCQTMRQPNIKLLYQAF